MKYIVVEIQTQANGTVAHIVTDHETQVEAESKYHTILAYAAVSELACHSATILTQEGFPIMHQCYRR